MIFVTQAGRRVVINPRHVVAVEPASDKDGLPVLNTVSVLTDLVPPNIPGAGHITINVQGDFTTVAAALLGPQTEYEAPSVEDDDIPF